MKKLLVIVFALGFFLNSCKIIDELTHFNMTFDEVLTLPPIPIIVDDPISFNYPFLTDSENTFLSYNTSKNLIEEIILKEASLTVINPTSSDFGFLKSISFYLDAEGLDEILIASKLVIADDIGANLYLDLEGQDLSEYLKKEAINLRVEVASDEIVTEDLDIKIHTMFAVDAKILGI